MNIIHFNHLIELKIMHTTWDIMGLTRASVCGPLWTDNVQQFIELVSLEVTVSHVELYLFKTAAKNKDLCDSYKFQKVFD